MTPKLIKELEDALKHFEDAEAYFESVYLAYRLARRYLDEAEALIHQARQAIKDYDEIDEDSLDD